MACHDKNSAKQLTFKGNLKEPRRENKFTSSAFKFAIGGENLSPRSGKCNVSSLRIPDDPTWPKNPQRRFADSVGDIIDQPCVVTVTGTPRRSRTLVITPNSLVMKGITCKESVDSAICGPSFLPQSTSQPMKRRPGCIDPRFKKVTSVKSQIKPTKVDEQNRETPAETSHSIHVIPNQIKPPTENVEHSEKDINVEANQQEIDKSNEITIVENKSQIGKEEPKELTKLQKSADNCENQQNENCLPSVTQEDSKDACETIPKINCDTKSSQETKETFKGTEESQETTNLTDGKSLKLSTSQLNEKKELEENKIEDGKESLCFICSEKANSQTREMCSKEAVPCPSCIERFKTLVKSSEGNLECQTQSEASGSLSDDGIYRTRCKEHMDDKESFLPATTDSEFVETETVTTLNRKKKLLNYYNSAGEESIFSAKDYELIDFFQTQGNFHEFHQAIDLSELEDKKEKLINNPGFKQKIKSEQNLSHGVGQNSRRSEPLIPMNQRRCVTSYSKRKVECPQGKEEMTDSEFAFLWPDHQRTRRKSSHGYSKKLIEERRNEQGKMSGDLERKSTSPKLKNKENHFGSDKNSLDCAPHPANFQELKKHFCQKLYQEPSQYLKSFVVDQNIQEAYSPRTETDIASEKPDWIPIKTQKLLSKSYWDYYRKLNKNYEIEDPQSQCFSQTTTRASQIKKKQRNSTIYEEQCKSSPPEIRTLKRCSVLSSIINKKLDSNTQPSDNLYKKQPFDNVKSSFDPTDKLLTDQTLLEISTKANDGYSMSSKSENKREESQLRIKLITLKTIAFVGILLYIIIIFLPMLYDHIFHEDYDEYEDLSYIELALDYVVSSYQEAFNGILDFINKILYRPVSV